MAVFEYQAIARLTGKTVKGVIDAESPAAARRKLREQDLSPTHLAETFGKVEAKGAGDGVGATRGRISMREVSLATRQLAVLLQAGMPLVEAMGALLDQTSNQRLRRVLYDVRAKVNEGGTLADALRGHPRVFSQLYVNMVGAGETSGALEAVLFRLADIQEHQVKLRNRLVSMLMYPIFMAVVGTGMVALLMAVVLPRIVVVFEKQKIAIPFMTRALMGICDFTRSYWWAVAIAAVCVYGLWRSWVAREEGRRRWDAFLLKLPLMGPLQTKLVCARFARTLGTMLESGLSMMNALDVVRSVVQNRVIENALDDVKSGVRRGRDLAAPLKESGVFPPMLVHMAELGQKSGQLEAMLVKAADAYDDDVEMTVEAMVGLLEPVMIVVMGGFVGFLVMSILLPILDMSNRM